MHELGLAGEPRLCHDFGMDFRQHPILDRGVPEPAAFVRLARDVYGQLGAGRSIAIHCRAGIGRSGMLACAVAVLTGLDCDAAIALVSAARGVRVPDTEEQAAFLAQLSCPAGGFGLKQACPAAVFGGEFSQTRKRLAPS
jgi:protein-tyrosine phosphatase